MLNQARHDFANKTARDVLIALIFGVAFFIISSHPTHAVSSISYDGCFERSTTGVSSVVWLTSPVCTITVVNPEPIADTITFSVLNMDPQEYKVEDSNGTAVSATRDDTTLFFSPTLQASSTTTFILSPWDYDPTTSDFWFVAISDTQNDPGGAIPNPIAINIISELETIHSAFTLNSGDVIKGSSTDEVAHMAEYAAYDQVFTQYDGTMFLVPGNHDTRQDTATHYGLYYGAADRSFVYGNTRFISINTREDTSKPKFTDAQWTWLENELSSATEENLVVFMHDPMVPPSWASANGFDSTRRLELAELFVEYGVDLLISGHMQGYDYQLINSEDIPGLTGSFYQLVTGGAGGELFNYEGEHFFTLMHISGNTMTPYLMEEDATDLVIDYASANDGTATEETISVFNDGTNTIPWYRIPIHIAATNTLYAALSDGTYVPYTTVEVDGVQHGALELSDLAAGESLLVTVKERRLFMTGMSNDYSNNGTLTFDTLPTAANVETGLSVASASSSGSVNMNTWNTETSVYSWRETTEEKAWTQFAAGGLKPDREYTVHVNGKTVDRVHADAAGALLFTYTGKTTQRNYQLVLEKRVRPTNIGILPAAGAGSNFQLYGDAGDLQQSFFSHGTDLSSGYESIWADIEGDRNMELLIVPTPGTVGHVRAFERNGTYLGGFYPFGEDYTDGINIAVGDMDNNGKQEIIIAPRDNRSADVQVYSYRRTGMQFKLLNSFTAYEDAYTGGVNIATGDIDGDGDDEIFVGARSQVDVVKTYKWKRKKQQAAAWLQARPFRGAQATQGFTLASGDVDMNGKDDLVVGSYSGGGTVRVLAHQRGKNSMKTIKGRRVFPSGFDGGVSILVGNINNTSKDEIIVSPRVSEQYSGRVKVFTAKKKSSKKRLKSLKGFKPFGTQATGELSIALSDVDKDWKMELVTAQKEIGQQIRVYKRIGKVFQQTDKYAIYNNGFNNGLSLTQSQ